MTPKERAAIQHALEAIGNTVNQALATIREALAEPQTTTPDVCGEVCARAKLCYGCNKDLEEANAKYVEQAEQEPVAEWEKLKDPQTLFVNLNRGFPAQLTHDHLLHLLNKTEQAEQEPYAYEVWDVQDQSFTMIYATQLKEFHWIEPENIARVLYAAPVRTKDLTDSEVADIGTNCGTSMWSLMFARAVIAADREKNK